MRTATRIEVLGELRRFLGGEKATTLPWDGLPVHRSTAMLAWIRTQRSWPVVERLPAYTLGAEPGRGAVAQPEGHRAGHLPSPSLAEVIDQAHRGIERVVRQTPHRA